MNEDNKASSPHEDPEWGRKQRHEGEKKPASSLDILAKLVKAIVFLVVGIFLLGGLVFATCLLSFSR